MHCAYTALALRLHCAYTARYTAQVLGLPATTLILAATPPFAAL